MALHHKSLPFLSQVLVLALHRGGETLWRTLSLWGADPQRFHPETWGFHQKKWWYSWDIHLDTAGWTSWKWDYDENDETWVLNPTASCEYLGEATNPIWFLKLFHRFAIQIENKLGVTRADGVTFPGWPSTAIFFWFAMWTYPALIWLSYGESQLNHNF